MLSTSFLACPAPRAVAPAMNDRMYADAATQANLATLRERGVRVIEPEEGALASRGEKGVGRLPSPDRLLAEVEALLPASRGSWDGLRVLVTAGGTREPIDSVRFIGNRSSGRMGLALAEQAARRGAQVTLVAASVSLPEPAGVRRIDVETAGELAAALREEFPACHVLFMAAAVADFRPAVAQAGKISREGSGGLDLRLEQTEDVLADLASLRSDRPDPGRFRGRARAQRDRAGTLEAGAQGIGRDRLQRRLACRDRLRLGAQRGGDRGARRASDESRSRPRRRSRPPSWTGWRRFAKRAARGKR